MRRDNSHQDDLGFDLEATVLKLLPHLRSVITLFFLFHILTPQNALGSHAVGGDISYRQLHGITYEITVRLTNESDHPSNSDSIEIFWGDFMIPRTLFMTDSFRIPDNLKYTLIEYRDTLTFPTQGEYPIRVWMENRIESISNAYTSDIRALYLETRLLVYDADHYCSNNSVLFTEPAAIFRYKSDSIRHYPSAIDPDGDSLTFHLVPTRDGPWTLIPGYSLPDSTQFDTITGSLLWTDAQESGIYVFSLLVNEYRSGKWISETRRDFCIFLDRDRDARKQFSWNGNWITDSLGRLYQEITVGDTLQFDLLCTDSLAGWIHITPYIELLESGDGASWLSWTGTDSAGGQFYLKADSTHPRNHAYRLIFSASSAKPGVYWPFPEKEICFFVYVNGPDPDTCEAPVAVLEPPPSGILTNDLPLLSVFPNPATERLIIEPDKRIQTDWMLQILDGRGNLVRQTTFFGQGQREVLTGGYARGTYYVRILWEGRTFTKVVLLY